LLQVSVILTSHLSRVIPRNPANAVLFYGHDVLLPALGWRLSWHLRDALGLTGATTLAGGLIAVVLACVVATQSRRCRVFVVTAVATGLLFSAVTSAIAWNGRSLPVTPRLEFGARYSTVPILLLDAALIVAADAYARRWWPRPRAIAAVAALVAVLAAGWATDFRYPVHHLAGSRSAWAWRADKWLRHCQRHPTGTITSTWHAWAGGWVQMQTTFSCTSLRR
jgi:hypothetical protein